MRIHKKARVDSYVRKYVVNRIASVQQGAAQAPVILSAFAAKVGGNFFAFVSKLPSCLFLCLLKAARKATPTKL